MAEVIITLEGSAASVRSSMIALLGAFDRELTTNEAPAKNQWSEDELRLLYKRLTNGAKRIIAEVATKPQGYRRGLLEQKLNMSAISIGAQRSSIGHNLKKFPGKPHPIRREAGDYRMDEPVADAILKIAAEEG